VTPKDVAHPPIPSRIHAYLTHGGDWWACEERMLAQLGVPEQAKVQYMPVSEHEETVSTLLEALKNLVNTTTDLCESRESRHALMKAYAEAKAAIAKASKERT
jgi:hypothetical protein